MPVQNVVDRDGFSMKLHLMKSKPWVYQVPLFNNEFLEKMAQYPLRDDDVLFCSYPKSGCHWIWEISRMLLTGSGSLDDISKEKYFMELKDTRIGSDIDALPSPRILNNHQLFDDQPADMLKKDTKVVFVYRNPKDVAVSYYFHMKRLPVYRDSLAAMDFSSFLRRYADGLIPQGFACDYLRDWERGIKENKHLNICMVSYEDLQENSLQEVRKLATFLGKDYDDEFLQKVIQETHIDNMRKVKASGPDDPKFSMKKSSMMYRKGKVGDWKNYFTVAESEWFDHIVRTRMRDSDIFNFRYEI